MNFFAQLWTDVMLNIVIGYDFDYKIASLCTFFEVGIA
jgi:hypothetical protein